MRLQDPRELPSVGIIRPEIVFMDGVFPGSLKPVADQAHVVCNPGLHGFQEDDFPFINRFVAVRIVEGREILIICDILSMLEIDFSERVMMKGIPDMFITEPVDRADDP